MIHGFALPGPRPEHLARARLYQGDHLRCGQAGRLLVLLHELLQRAASRDARPDGRAAERLDRHADRLARRREREGAGRRRACPRRETTSESADDLRRRRRARGGGAGLPLWGFAMSAPQYPDETLHLQMQRTGIVGDVQEVSTLQHYIGVRFPTDMPELKWSTRAIVAFAALLLLGAFVGAGMAGRAYRVLCAVALFTFLVASAAVVQARPVPGRPRSRSGIALAGIPQFHAAAGRPGEGRQLHGVVVPARRRA